MKKLYCRREPARRTSCIGIFSPVSVVFVVFVDVEKKVLKTLADVIFVWVKLYISFILQF